MKSQLPRGAVVLLAVLAISGIAAAGARGDEGEPGKWAIVIGVQQYPKALGFAALRYAERDAQAIYDVLIDPERGGFDPGRVKLLTTAAKEFDKLPTRGNILAAINLLARWARADPDNPPDTVVVYFSGHGMEVEGTSYLVPADASSDDLENTAIPLETVWDRLDECGAKKQITIIDACRSQAMPGKAGGDAQSVAFARALEEFARAKGRVVLASCSADQTSYEDEERGHSAFTAVLLEAMRGDADDNSDGVITLSETYEHVSRELRSWAEKRGMVQYPSLYGEITLRVPLVRCPAWAEVRIASLPDEAEIWIDGEDTGRATPDTVKIDLQGVQQRTLRIRLRKDGYQDLEREVTLGAGDRPKVVLPLRESAKLPPGLKPMEPGPVSTTFYRGAGHVSALALRPDGSLLVAVASSGKVPAGVYVAREGEDRDPKDAYCSLEDLSGSPSGLLVHPDGRVLVADSGASVIWAIPASGGTAEVLTDEIRGPRDILIAPPSFDGPRVDPGDLLVCATDAREAARGGLYIIDRETLAVQRLAGPTEQGNNLVHAAFGPGGTLYAVQDDARTRNGFTIVTVSPDGKAAPFVENHRIAFERPNRGPVAVHPGTGDVYFGYRSSIYRASAADAAVETFAVGGQHVTDLEFSDDGEVLYVADAGAQLVAKIAPYSVDGALLVWGADPSEREALAVVLTGNSLTLEQVGDFEMTDISPLLDRAVGNLRYYDLAETWRTRSDVWRIDVPGGRNAMGLSFRAGLGGINCKANWSPDGSRISFNHCDPEEGVLPCDTGFSVWVMDADGNGARMVAPAKPQVNRGRWWSPNGDRLMLLESGTEQLLSIDVRDGDGETLPLEAAWEHEIVDGPVGSPDGSRLAFASMVGGMLDGEPGTWRRLGLADGDGGNPHTLVQHFIPDREVDPYMASLGEDPSDQRWRRDLLAWVGPIAIAWSPRGDRIAFLAALPFDPQGPVYKQQLEIWIYDIATGVLAKLTDNTVSEEFLMWRGPNTHPDDPDVTVGSARVTFTRVKEPGLTTVIRDDRAPGSPGGYRVGGHYYDIRTTAEHEGPVTICIRYGEEEVLGGDEASLTLLHYKEEIDTWEDITTSRDPKTNVVCGIVDSL